MGAFYTEKHQTFNLNSKYHEYSPQNMSQKFHLTQM